jgi:hypothetical protein
MHEGCHARDSTDRIRETQNFEMTHHAAGGVMNDVMEL